MNKTIYEWRIDALDEYGDVLELYCSDIYDDIATEADASHLCGFSCMSAPYLTRRRYFVDIACDYWDLEDEQECYSDCEFNGKFNGGATVPKRFHKFFQQVTP